MLIDAHLHLTREDVENHFIEMMEKNQLYGLVTATNPAESKWVRQLARETPHILPTYGLHPWYADQYDLSEMEKYLAEAAYIGEIGMDSVWCHVDLELQRKVFMAQMDMAEKKGCPIILHTKGREKEIGQVIQDYTMPILVHWYSCQDHLDLYLMRDCYFTMGPDVRRNKAVEQVVREVPINRLFVESDGFSALEWALGKTVEAEALPGILRDSMAYMAAVKGLRFSQVEDQMVENFRNLFLKNQMK